MKKLFFTAVLLFSTLAFGQEIGSIQNGNHSIKLIKNENNYSLLYSDINDDSDNSFIFPKIESVYKIIFDGFKNTKNHLVIVKTINDTIVKFEYKSFKGVKMLKIRQNNLQSNTFGTSTFFTREEMVELFESP